MTALMLPEDLNLVGVVVRTCQAVGAAKWWLRLSARNAMIEVVAQEAERLTAELTAATGPINGTLRMSLKAGSP